jgi:hypothetical protein
MTGRTRLMRRSALIKVPSLGELRGLVEEQVLHDDEFHVGERGLDVRRVGIGLGDVLALDVDRLEIAGARRVEHVGNTESGFGIDAYAPVLFKLGAHVLPRDVAVAGQFVRERSHVAGALHVVLAP